MVTAQTVNTGSGAGAATAKATACKTTGTVNYHASGYTDAAYRDVVARRPAPGTSAGKAGIWRRIACAATNTGRRCSAADTANAANYRTGAVAGATTTTAARSFQQESADIQHGRPPAAATASRSVRR
jgi:hypothetical protein